MLKSRIINDNRHPSCLVFRKCILTCSLQELRLSSQPYPTGQQSLYRSWRCSQLGNYFSQIFPSHATINLFFQIFEYWHLWIMFDSICCHRGWWRRLVLAFKFTIDYLSLYLLDYISKQRVTIRSFKEIDNYKLRYPVSFIISWDPFHHIANGAYNFYSNPRDS